MFFKDFLFCGMKKSGAYNADAMSEDLSHPHTEAELFKAHRRSTGKDVNVRSVDGDLIPVAVPAAKRKFLSRIPGRKLFRGDGDELTTPSTFEAMAAENARDIAANGAVSTPR